MLVDFMMIGAQKCATTRLAQQLGNHPEICFCKIKEPKFFNNNQNWKDSLEQYHSLYSPALGQICGEASTMYSSLPEWQRTHSRLYAYNPNLKLIYIMRQPVERVISFYAHQLIRREVKGPPENIVFANPSYINRSRYGVQIRPYLELFPRENILLLLFEEYVRDQVKVLNQIAEFLGVSSNGFQNIDAYPKHSSIGEGIIKPPFLNIVTTSPVQALLKWIPSSTRKDIRPYFAIALEKKPEFSQILKETIWRFVEDDVVAIEEILGHRLDIWRNSYTS